MSRCWLFLWKKYRIDFPSYPALVSRYMPVTSYSPPVTTPRTKVRQLGGRQTDELPPEERSLSADEEALLEGLRNGTADFGKVQREVAARAFEKILRDPKALKVKDWLTSELIKIKKEESQAKIGMMEVFVRKLFSGRLPTNCQHCGRPLFQEGEVLDAQSVTTPELLA